MPVKAFLDTNILIYAIAEGDPRAERAESLLAAGGAISVQVLNEFVAVARRKIRMSWKEVNEALDAIRILCSPPLPLTTDTHVAALKIAEGYGYEFYGALVLASALEAGCSILYSEDLQHGQVIDRKLTIQNPFR
jgi:predicted nucleic acid-binding protein